MKQYTLNFCETADEVHAVHGPNVPMETMALSSFGLDELAEKILSGDYGPREMGQLAWALNSISKTMDVPPIIDAAAHILGTILNTTQANAKARENPLARAINLGKDPQRGIRDTQIAIVFHSLIHYGKTWEQAQAYIADRVNLSENQVQAIYRNAPKQGMVIQEPLIDAWLKKLAPGGY